MQLDVRTLVLVAAITSALVALALALALRAQPPALRDSIRAWTGGIALQALGWLLIGFRGQWPDALSFVLANTAVALGYAECVRALRRFDGQRVRPLAPYLLALAVLAISIYTTWIAPDRYQRMLGNSVALAAVFALATLAALRVHLGPGRRPASHWLVAGVFAFGTGVLLVRVASLLQGGPTPPGTRFEVGAIELLLYASTAFGPVLATFGFALMCNDHLNAELERLAAIDPLTGVHNRRSLEYLGAHAIAMAARRGRGVALLLIDADHFKRVNDEHGHDAGDAALRALVGIVRGQARDEDVLGRLGGEEFVLLLPEADEAAAVALAERVRAAVAAAPVDVGGARVALRVSIGVAAWAQGGDDWRGLLRNADRALYEAKRRGRDRVQAASELPEL